MVFAFGITPKRVLHDIVATHTDSIPDAGSKQSHDVAIGTAGFNCQCDNLISESPFVEQPQSFYIVLQIVFASHSPAIITGHSSAAHISFGLRGPPTV